MAYLRMQSLEASSGVQGREGKAFGTDPLQAAGRDAPRAPRRAEWGAGSKHDAISVFLIQKHSSTASNWDSTEAKVSAD